MHQQNWQEPLIFDWSGANGPPITEEDLHNSDIGRILRNEFYPPFHQTEYVRQRPWWNPRDPFGNNAQQRSTAYIPGKQPIPKYPQLSTLTKREHLFGLRVLSTTYGVQPWDYPSPEQEDYGLFDEIIEKYENEIRSYRIWARMCWTNGDCIRTLHPKPILETVYDALFEHKINEIRNLPQSYTAAAQISLENGVDVFEIKHLKDLKTVDVNTLPEVECPGALDNDVSILYSPWTSEPVCKMNSDGFKLPNNNKESTNRSAHYAMQNGNVCIASENSLRCLLETERSWLLPLSIEDMICPESGDVKTVVVMGSEFFVKKECGAQRTLKAFRYLLIKAFTQPSETSEPSSSTQQPTNSGTRDEPIASCSFSPSRGTADSYPGCSSNKEKIEPEGTTELPPPRSFKKWQVKNTTSDRSFDLIIHSSHKVREGKKEVILEPIVEWQPELGACKQSAGRLRALALSLMMRPNANLINVRLDYNNGNIIVIDKLDEGRFIRWHGDKKSEIADRIHTAIDQLRFLKQGQYILKHDPCHGANAMLYSTQEATGFVCSSGELKLSLRPSSDKMSEEEEAALAKIAPQLSRAMLPYHKDQGILPLAFTPDKNHVKEDKKVIDAIARARLPPPGNQPGASGVSKKKKKKKKKQQPANEK